MADNSRITLAISIIYEAPKYNSKYYNNKPSFLKGYNLKCLRNKPEKKYCYGFTVI